MRTMARGVHSQRMQLVQRHPLAPTWFQRVRVLIPLDDRRQFRAAEQRQHRQICLTVSAVRGRIDHHHPFRSPHHISVPQITMDPCRALIVVERPRGDQLTRRPGVRFVGRAEVSGGHRIAEKWEHSLAGVEIAPRGGRV